MSQRHTIQIEITSESILYTKQIIATNQARMLCYTKQNFSDNDAVPLKRHGQCVFSAVSKEKLESYSFTGAEIDWLIRWGQKSFRWMMLLRLQCEFTNCPPLVDTSQAKEKIFIIYRPWNIWIRYDRTCLFFYSLFSVKMRLFCTLAGCVVFQRHNRRWKVITTLL